MTKKTVDKINAYFILKSGRIKEIKNLKVEDDKVEYNKGAYLVKKEARILKKTRIFGEKIYFCYIEGIPEPVNFNNIKKNKILLDSQSLLAILKRKLFKDLFADPSEQLKQTLKFIFTIVILVLAGINVIISVDIADKMGKVLMSLGVG